MKIPIYVILLLSLTSSSPNQKMWQTSCYNRATFQQEATWCVHACMEISFGIPQCVSVHNWLYYSNILIPATLNCCGVITLDKKYFCVDKAGVSRSEITRFLSEQYSPIVGQFTTLWDLLSHGEGVVVAYLSLRNSLSYHLVVLYLVREIGDNLYEITYCDPEMGRLNTITNPNPIEIIYQL